ncbi:classical arabinogalactan protein 1 [Capsicum chacoense]
MATVRVLSFTFLFGVLLVQQCICTDAPASSPTPAPESGADVPFPSVTPAPSPSSNLTSPPAPPPSDFPPAPSSVNATSKESPSPAPTPAPNLEVASDISHASTEESKESSGGGMTSGKKAGIAVGVIAAVCFVGLGALVYKKRQQNIQRSQFGYDARREIL